MNIDHSKLSGTKIILGSHCVLQVRRHSASIVDFIMNRKNYVKQKHRTSIHQRWF